MALKTVLFVVLFLAACLGTFISPIWPLLGYVAHYCVGPERQWWHAPIADLGIRYSMTLGVLTLVAMFFHAGKLQFGKSPLCAHEMLLLGFLGAVWLSVLIGPTTVGRYIVADHVSVKISKVILFTLMLTHVVTDFKNLDRLLWVLIIGSMILGMQAWDTPYRSFVQGRLENVGGPDFANSNYFGAFMATMMWPIGVQFLRSGWRGKLLCFLSGGFTANAIILTRSRGAVVGLAAGGIMALVMAPKRFRIYIALGLVLGAAGFYYLTDERFLERSETITASAEERDDSAKARLDYVQIGLRMWANRPWGVGPGNFPQFAGNYDHTRAGRDAHNSYIRCLTELGAQGFAFFLALFVSALWMLYQMRREKLELPDAQKKDVMLLSLGIMCSLAVIMAVGLAHTLTYIEFTWWFLALPVCLRRIVDNARLPVAKRHKSLGAMFRQEETSC